MAALRLALLIVGITVASGWLLQRVELLYNGPHLAGAALEWTHNGQDRGYVGRQGRGKGEQGG